MSAVLLVNLVVFVTVVAGAGLLFARRLPLAWRQAALAASVGLVLVAPLGAWMATGLGQLEGGFGSGTAAGPGAATKADSVGAPWSTEGALHGDAAGGADSGRGAMAAATTEAGATSMDSAMDSSRDSSKDSTMTQLLGILRRHGLVLGFGALLLGHVAWTLWRWRRGRRVLARLRFVPPSAPVRAAWARLAARFEDLDLGSLPADRGSQGHAQRESIALGPGGRADRASRRAATPRRAVSLVASPDVATPFVLASARPLAAELAKARPGPVLVVPAAWPALSAAETEAVLAHELGHVRAGHLTLLRWQAAAWLAYGWHPLVRLLDRALERTKETVADQCATRTHAERRSLAQALVAFATLRTEPAPGHAALELHLSPLTARVEDLLDDHDAGSEGELEPPRRLGRREHALLALGTGAVAVLAACTGVRHAEPEAPHQLDQPPGQTVLETTSAGQPVMVTTRPAPAHPDDLEFPGLQEQGGAHVYPSTRRSTDWIGGQAVDFGVVDGDVRLFLSLTGTLIATDAATGAVLWRRDVSAFYDTLRFMDRQFDGERRRVVRLEQHGLNAPELWAYHLMETGAEVENPAAAPVPSGNPTPLSVWSGWQAARDEPLHELVRTEARWREVYEELFVVDGAPLPDAPPRALLGVDFEREGVLVWHLGRSSNCRGVGLNAAYLDAERLLVRIHEFTYQSAAFGDAEPERKVERPWGVFRIPRIWGGEELVVERNAQRMIMGPAIWSEVGRFDLE